MKSQRRKRGETVLGNLFLFILNRGIAAGWLIVAVIVIRLFLKRVPRRIVCFLWTLAAIRLLVPFFPESAFSLIPSRDTFQMVGTGTAAAEPTPPDKEPEDSRTADYGESVSGETATQKTLLIHTGFEDLDNAIETYSLRFSENGNPAEPEKPAETGAEAKFFLSLAELLSYVWMGGIVFLLGGTVISYLCLRRKVRISVERTAGVFVCDGIDTPFILGFLSPKICLPSTLGGEEKEYALAHERAHLKNRDHWWKVIGYALLLVYWVNPLVWVGYVLFCKDLEIACDERVVADKDISYRRAYAMALLSCSVSGRRIAAYPLAFGEVSVKERIKSVLRYRKPAVWITVVGVVLCGIVLVCFLTDPEGSSKDSDSVTMIQVMTPENVKVEPEIVEYDFESACEKGEVRELRGMFPGTAEGIWYTIEIDGVEYFYGRLDYDPDKVELYEYAIVSGDYSLANGISVGMTKREIIELYPDMAIVDTEGNILNEVSGHQGWNGISYPRSRVGMDEAWDYGDNDYYYWADQFDYIMIADVLQPKDTLPIYLALMMEDGKVAAITFCLPTAG